MAFGFLGSLTNIPLLSQVRRGRRPLEASNSRVGSIALCPSGWDPSPCAPQSEQSPGMEWHRKCPRGVPRAGFSR